MGKAEFLGRFGFTADAWEILADALLTKADAGLVQLAELVEEAFEDAQVLARPHGVPVVLGDCTGNLMTGDRHRRASSC